MYVGFDFVANPMVELTFYNSAQQPIVRCIRSDVPLDPECLQLADE